MTLPGQIESRRICVHQNHCRTTAGTAGSTVENPWRVGLDKKRMDNIQPTDSQNHDGRDRWKRSGMTTFLMVTRRAGSLRAHVFK